MSLINEYRSTEQAIQELQARLQTLAGDDRLKQEIAFEEKLRSLMGEYGKSLRDVIAILDPKARKRDAQPAGASRRERKVKVYLNPHTQETIESKGGNNKTLKAWKEKWGAAAVESWVKPD